MDTALAPGFARTTYSGASGIHHALTPLNIDPAAVGGIDPNVTLKGATTVLASVAMASFWDVVKDIMGTDQNIGLCEIYKVDATTGEGTFLWGFDLDLVGDLGMASVAMNMSTISFKLINGHVYKLTLMDSPFPVNTKDYSPFPDASTLLAAADYISGGTSPVYGRGNAYPFAPIARTTKTSDALRARAGLS